MDRAILLKLNGRNSIAGYRPQPTARVEVRRNAFGTESPHFTALPVHAEPLSPVVYADTATL
jgi:hypothetical protein